MNRFKIYSIFTIIALATCFAACTNEEDDWSGPKNGISATIVDNLKETRAVLLDNPGVRLNTFWQAGDHIGIYGDNGQNVDFTLTASTLSTNGKTATFQTTSSMPTGSLFAYYPYSGNTTGNNEKIVLNFGSEQNYTITNGVPQPDPKANIMMAKGTRSSGLSFYPVLSVLKIGKLFEEETQVKSVEFRDLDNQPVFGSITATWSNGRPSVEFSGTGKVITLNCGQQVKANANESKLFYIIAPARKYPKGFEITFVTDKGSRITQTVGATMGKTLEPGVIYPIGDIMDYQSIEGTSSELYPQAILMTPDNQDKSKILTKSKVFLEDGEGNPIYDRNMYQVSSYELDMMIDKSLKPLVGGWLIYDTPTDDMPKGGVFRITKCEKYNDQFYRVIAEPEVNPFAPFKSLKIGDPIYNEQGEYQEDGGIELDLTGYIKEIVDEDGNSIDFRYGPNGELLFGDEAVEQMVKAGTRASVNNMPDLNLPPLSICAKGNNAEATFTPQVTTKVKTAIGSFDGELQYIYLNVSPKFTLDASFLVKAGIGVDYEKYLFGVKTLGIPICGVLVSLDFELYGKVGARGEMTFSTTLKCTQDLGSYTISYNKGDGNGFNMRTNRSPSLAGYNLEDPTISGGGTVYIQGGVSLRSMLEIYATANIGFTTDFLVKGSFIAEEGTKDNGMKFVIGPELEFYPTIAVNFRVWKWAHHFKELTLKIPLDPWYERYFYPASASSSVSPTYNHTKEEYRVPIDGNLGYEAVIANMRTGVDKIKYGLQPRGKCFKDHDFGVAIYKVKNYKYSFSNYAEENMFNAFESAGIPFLAPTFGSNVEVADSISELVAVEKIGTYPANVEKMDFQGEYKPSYSFQSGQLYRLRLAYIEDNKIAYLIGGYSQYLSQPLSRYVYYSWPNDIHGGEYVLADPDAERENE